MSSGVSHHHKRKRDEDDDGADGSDSEHSRGHAGAAPMDKAARRAAQKAAKRRKLLEAQQCKGGVGAVVTPATASAHPFPVDPRDHAETPFEAYRDIEPLLFRLAVDLGLDKSKLRIYDPFYCEGSMRTHLAKLGFTNVINDNRDFYRDLAAGQLPEGWDKDKGSSSGAGAKGSSSSRSRPAGIPPHDVIVTNPPFSADHIRKTLAWVAASGKPFFLLLPDFTARKAHYVSFLSILLKGLKASGTPAAGASGEASAAAAGAGAGAGAGLEEGAQGNGWEGDAEEEEENGSSGGSIHGGPHPTRRPVPIHPGIMSYMGPTTKAYMFAAPGRDMDGAKPLVPGLNSGAGMNKEGRDPSSSSSSSSAPRPFHVFAMTFQCVWFMHLGPKAGRHEAITSWWQKRYGTLPKGGRGPGGVPPCNALLSDDMSAMPQLARDPNAKRKAQASRPWRKKLMRQRKKAARQGDGDGDGDGEGEGDED